MKNINIQSLLQAREFLQKASFDSYLQYHGIHIKCSELEDLKSLVEMLGKVTNDVSVFDGFYVGYKIPQIGKEFDLLRFGNECVINVELKRTSSEEKIKKQLIRNKYYLSYIDKQIWNVTYVSDSKDFYILNKDETLGKIGANFLEELLAKQDVGDREDVDNLFDPSDYLVSPFNSTQKFLDEQYFLTHQQEDVKTKIINSLISSSSANFISVVGGAGTGKTLLVYDVVKELIENKKKPLVIHCGYLNEGQEKLKEHGFTIIPIKSYTYYDLSNYDPIIIDEAQRIYAGQLEKIIETITIAKGNCIFSYDKLQTLAKWEEVSDIDSKINSIKHLTAYKLSEKIRTNHEIATFIKMLFNNKRNLDLSSKGNIEVNYFQSLEDAKSYLSTLDNQKWEVLRFTPSQYGKEHHEQYSEPSKKTSHKVIGQEFDGVVVTIDRFFTYDEGGKLAYSGGAYYYPVKMLFQNITRARKRLKLVIIDNEELLNRCISILQ